MRLYSYLYFYQQEQGDGSFTGVPGMWDNLSWGTFSGLGGTCASTPTNTTCGLGTGGNLERDRWYLIETQVKMNTSGQSDGIIHGWVDGQLSYEKTNMIFRILGHDNLHARTIWMNVYKGGVSGNTVDSEIYLDQMAIATNGRLGAVSGNPAPTPTPTPTPTPSTKFNLNDRVQTTQNLNVRSTPSTSATLLGTQATGNLGTISGGPTQADGFTWWNVNYDTAPDGWSVEDYLVKVNPTPTPTPLPSPTPSPTPTPGPLACSQYTPSSVIPTGFASPYDVVSSPTTNLMNATCLNLTDARLDLGKGDPLQYIYNQGYLFKTGGTNWTPIPYTSPESLIASAWYPKTANTTITMTQTELANPSYNLAYICSWVGSAWKCGCRDSACTQSYWQIQSFKR